MARSEEPELHSSVGPVVAPGAFSRLAEIVIFGLLIVAVLGFVVFAIRFWRFTVDDAFITFRYAGNLVRGWGLTFNEAPPRAEGYTSILWTLLMAIPQVAGADVVLFSKLVGVGLTLGTVLVMGYGILRGPGVESGRMRRLGAGVAVTLFLSFSSSAVHAVAGMETAMATFLYAVTAVLFLRAQGGVRSTPLLPLACLALGLTRPEANLYSAILLGVALWSMPKPMRRGFARSCLAFYILPGAVYFAWRTYHYGALLPLPFYMKSASADLSGLEPTLSFVKNVLVGFSVPIAVLLVSTARKRALLLLPMLCLVAYFVTIEHIMGYGHRYFFPLVPVLALLSGLAVSAGFRSGMGAGIQAAIVLSLGLGVTLGSVKTLQATHDYLSYARGMDLAHIPFGRALATVPWRSPPLLAIGDAGAVPYYSGLPTIDTNGLNDAAIARGDRGHRALDVLDRVPTIVVLISQSEDTFDSPLAYEDELWPACRARGYRRQVTFVFADAYFLWVLWRPDSPDANRLGEVLGRASRTNHEASRNH